MRNLEYPTDQACPHDGWYNGNPNLMIANGTYADYRHRLVAWVEKGKLSQADLNGFDARWAQVPLQMKKERRQGVIEGIKKVPVKSREGKIDYVSKPSDNGRGSLDAKKPALRRQLSQRQPLGSIDTRPDPFGAEEAAMLAGGSLGEEVGATQKGHAVPEFVPKSAPARTPALAAAL